MKNRFLILGSLLVLSASSLAFAQDAENYRIAKTTYDIKGVTKEFPLSQAVEINYKKIMTGRDALEFYIKDLEVQFQNQRVLQNASIEYTTGEKGADGIITVYLVVHTKDTWNIIAFPYPKYDSNSGFEFKIKIKNFNFFGSMQVMDADVNFGVDENNHTSIASNFSFTIPFQAFGYGWNWDNDFGVKLREAEVPEVGLTTGISIDIPFFISKLTVGVEQSLMINDRDDDDVLYSDDRLYFQEKLYTELPITLHSFGPKGDLVWTPDASITTNISPDGVVHEDLRGSELAWGHSLSLGRVNWLGNFRKGYTASIGNNWSYNFDVDNQIELTIDGTVTGFATFFDHFGLASRFYGYYTFAGETSKKAGPLMRGILDKRIVTDSAYTLSIDIPVRVMRVDFLEITGVRWTRFIGFDMQLSPFFDMTLAHDAVTKRYYSIDDGWYSGGFEMIIYPARMRSIYGRISAGFDLDEVLKTGKLSGTSSRDGYSIRELFLGIGLHY